ncbi:MAG: TfoX/Sxy family DNA transformation protein [Salibacteraceae bacterium]
MKKLQFQKSHLSGLKNIGDTVAQRLNEIGVYTKAELQHLGPSEAYRQMKANYPNRTLPVCYYLYSLEGALLDCHWDDLSQDQKLTLRQDAGL